MKATTQKLKKLKTKQVYGFKKDNFNTGGNAGFDTTVITTSSAIIVPM